MAMAELDSGESDESDGNDVSSVEALDIARKESRHVLDQQIALLYDIDDKAMRTVRTALLLIGILLSAAGILGREGLSGVETVTLGILGTSILCLLLVVIVGTATYSVTSVPFGVSSPYRDEVRTQGYDENEWLLEILDGYDEWTNELREENKENAFLLLVTQGTLLLALALLVIAGSLLAMP